jgi:ribose transport system permease protein
MIRKLKIYRAKSLHTSDMNAMRLVKTVLQEHGTLLALALLIIVAICLFPTLAQKKVIFDILSGYSMIGVVAMGMTFVILAGGIDLSVGSIAALSGITAAMLMDRYWVIPAIGAIVMGALLGFINGAVIAKLKAPPFIATLAMMIGARGAILIVSGEKPLPFKEQNDAYLVIGHGATFGIPNLIIVFVTITVLCVIVSKWTKFGRSVYVLGGNEEASRMMGFNADRIKILVYTISGTMSGIAGMMLTSRLSSAQNTAGQGWELTAIGAVVIGGTLLAGGRGKFSGTFYGVLIYAVIEVLLGRFNLMVWYINILTGCLIIGVVIMQSQAAKLDKLDKMDKLTRQA